MNGTRRDIRPEMNSTSRDSRSSLATDRALAPLGLDQRGLQLRPRVERVRALAGFHLDALSPSYG
jgi:hypothetical protein